MNLHELLLEGVAHKASDIHLASGMPPMIRVHNELLEMGKDALSDSDIREGVSRIMPAGYRTRFEQSMDACFVFDATSQIRFRAAVFMQQRGLSAAFRPILLPCPTLEDLGVPQALSQSVIKPRGLILVAGPAGAGKTTTLAAMVRHINTHCARHVLLIENPIEFVHAPDKSLIQQREIGIHARSFPAALRAAQHENAEVILVGEMRDADTIRLAIAAAESGHLVLGAMPTSGAARTIERLIEFFPTHEREMIRTMLAESIEAVVSQVLCKRIDMPGRVAAHEVMVGSTSVRNLIRDGKIAQMYSSIQTGASAGMQTLDQSMTALVRQGMISMEDARLRARFPDDFS